MAVVAAIHASLASYEQPDTKANQQDGPKSVHFEKPDPQVVQEEKHTQPDQDHSSGRHASGEITAVARAEHCPKSERVRGRLPQLQSLRRFNRIDQLIKIKRSDAQAEDSSRRIAGRVTGSHNQENENDQVGQSLGVLAAVNRTNSEREKSCQYSSNGRMRTRSRQWLDSQPCTLVHYLLICRLRRRGPGHAFCQAVLAIDHAHHLASAVGAEWFAASAAIRSCRSL